MLHTPPSNPDIKRELKNQLLNMTPRGFELFAGEFLVYVGLEKVSVTRYIGDGGIDAEGDLIADPFRIPVGVQVKRYRKNVQRTDIDRFIGALSGRFSEGLFKILNNSELRSDSLKKSFLLYPQGTHIEWGSGHLNNAGE